MKTKIIHQSGIKRTCIPILLLLLLALPLLPCNATPMAKKAKFKGTWALNESKSDFGDYGRMWASDKLIIIQKRKTLSIEKFSTGPSGEQYNYMENYTLDGIECENPMFEQSKKISTVNWSEDNQSLTIKSTLDIEVEGQQMKIDTIEILSLQDDGNTLVIKGTAITDYGDMVVEFIYDLQ